MPVCTCGLTVSGTGVQQVCPQYKGEVRQCILTVQDPETGAAQGRLLLWRRHVVDAEQTVLQ